MIITAEGLDVFVEPRLKPPSDRVDLGVLWLISVLTGHENTTFGIVENGLNKLRSVLTHGELFKLGDHLLPGVSRMVLEMHPWLHRTNAKTDCSDEAERTVGPGQRMEKFRVLFTCALDHRAVGDHDLIPLDQVTEETILVRAALHTVAGNQTTHSQILELGSDQQSVSVGLQLTRQMTHVHQWFHSDNLVHRIHFKDVLKLDFDLIAFLLVRRKTWRHAQPGGTSSAEKAFASVITPHLDLGLNVSHTFRVLEWCRTHAHHNQIAKVPVDIKEGTERENHRDDDQPTVLNQKISEPECEATIVAGHSANHTDQDQEPTDQHGAQRQTQQIGEHREKHLC
mmetsp:Transcript_44717/g.112718  ORF Transcript_44717/g.112718 Transcript_44717/m.112718 type:complete len:340 (-) Transcript_44717:230-1249(-)